MYSTSANLRTTPSLQQLFSQGGAESQRGDHGLRRYFLFCQFYIFNSFDPKFLELINSAQLRKIRIPIVSDAECDRYSGLHLKVTTFEHVCFFAAFSICNEYHHITFAPGMCFTTTSQQCKTYLHFQIAR